MHENYESMSHCTLLLCLYKIGLKHISELNYKGPAGYMFHRKYWYYTGRGIGLDFQIPN
jgi:hypothetical protein